ncbi:MAG: B12-binding domain-containing radical SAM protein [Candidatus Binatia bacterium]|nr:B12-binding domain-containing radical SAM protein [Candidatus Binatia bacterium]
MAHPGDGALDLAAPAAGRRLRVVLLTFYNYESHALRIFHPLLQQRGHDVHSIFFKNYFTYVRPTPEEEDMVVDLVARLRPDLVAVSVWSTYYRLAARLSERIKAQVNPVIIWGGIHAQTRSEECLQHADIVCRGEGEYVLAELTDRLGLGEDYTDLAGCWVRRGNTIVRNPPRPLIADLDVLPLPDLSPENKYYLGNGRWRDVARWDRAAVSYDVMAVRGCPFQCTFCIHNFTRPATRGLGTYIRRRSVEHVLAELRMVKASRPRLEAIAFSDDIFAPPRPWLEEFCARYKQEIGLPFVIFSFPGMVDEAKVRLMRDAGLWCTTIGVQSGSERIRRECYERATPNETIIEACRILAKHGVVRNLDFILDNPYETDEDRRETIDLLCRLPKPFYANFFSLTYFPGVDLTERALHDGFITPDDVEDRAEKGYHLWGGALMEARGPEALYWDVLYAMAVHGVPRWVILRLMKGSLIRRHLRQFVRLARWAGSLAQWKKRHVDRWVGRPNLLDHFFINTNREDVPAEPVVHPNFGQTPFSVPQQVTPAAKMPLHPVSSARDVAAVDSP